MDRGQIVITPGLSNMLYKMYAAWEDNERPFFPTEKDYVELKNFVKGGEPMVYTLPDGVTQLVFNIFNGGRDE